MSTTTKKERSEQTRAQLLEIAIRLFSVHGFAAVTLRDIADEAKLNHAMIRYYFGDKESLWRECAAFVFERIAKEAPKPQVGELASDQVVAKNYIRNYVRYCARYPEHTRFMIQESISGSDRLRWVAENYIRPLHAETIKIISHISQQMGMGHLDPLTLLYMITAMAQSNYLLAAEIQVTHERDTMTDAAIEAHAESIISILYRTPTQ
ncbi:TPA: TetR/AcrR family transcriptional regulator [Pseudomonas aeruginosa]